MAEVAFKPNSVIFIVEACIRARGQRASMLAEVVGAMRMTHGIQCKCGRFLANVGYVLKFRFLDPYLADVRGDCKRCGKDVPALRDSDAAWWFSWDAWSPDIDRFADECVRDICAQLDAEAAR